MTTQRSLLSLQKATQPTQQLARQLVRDMVVVSRYGLALDGDRLRDSDLTGTE